MNLESVSSAATQDEACSLRSLLALGCRSRAEAFAKKLQTKLWTLGHMEANGQSEEASGERNVHSWVTVEARLDPNNSVVTSVPVVSKMYRDDLGLRREETNALLAATRNSENESGGSDTERWGVLFAGPVGRESVDRESNGSSNKLSDSDQYFDFGIDSPVDPDFAPELRNEEVVVNIDDGLPSQPESGCVFTSPVQSESDSPEGGSDEDTSFYDIESLSQSPANPCNKTMPPAFELPTAYAEDNKRTGENKQNNFLDPNYLQNNIEKVIPNKLTGPEEFISSQGFVADNNTEVTVELEASGVSSLSTFSSLETETSKNCGESLEQTDLIAPFWQQTCAPAQCPDGISTIKADVLPTEPRGRETREHSQGDLEDDAEITNVETVQYTRFARDERFCYGSEKQDSNFESKLCLEENFSQPQSIVSSCLSSHFDDITHNAISRTMREVYRTSDWSSRMHHNESSTLIPSADPLQESESISSIHNEQITVSDLKAFSGAELDNPERTSDSSSGYADNIGSSCDGSDAHGSEVSFGENESDDRHSETVLQTAIPKQAKNTNCHHDNNNECEDSGPEKDQDVPTIESPVTEQDDNCDREDEDLIARRHRVQRSTSLKSGKTPPGTPGRKKIVRFADALGLDLALVRTFMDDIPNVPQSAFKDLEDVEQMSDSHSDTLVGFNGPYPRRQDLPIPTAVPTVFRTLIACFTSPGNLTDFLDRLKNQKVCLETAAMAEDMTIRGMVRCLNIDFHKSVILRVTTDEWLTFTDVTAEYVLNSCDGLSDRFSFNLLCHSLQPGQRVIFAVSYRVAGQEFWDNNFGLNYVFQCVAERNLSSSASSLLASPMSDWLPYM